MPSINNVRFEGRFSLPTQLKAAPKNGVAFYEFQKKYKGNFTIIITLPLHLRQLEKPVEKTVLALYKHSWASWRLGGEEFKVENSGDKYSSLGLVTDAVGSLSLLTDGGGSAGAALEHILLTCVAIEKQIRVAQGYRQFQ